MAGKLAVLGFIEGGDFETKHPRGRGGKFSVKSGAVPTKKEFVYGRGSATAKFPPSGRGSIHETPAKGFFISKNPESYEDLLSIMDTAGSESAKILYHESTGNIFFMVGPNVEHYDGVYALIPGKSKSEERKVFFNKLIRGGFDVSNIDGKRYVKVILTDDWGFMPGDDAGKTADRILKRLYAVVGRLEGMGFPKDANLYIRFQDPLSGNMQYINTRLGEAQNLDVLANLMESAEFEQKHPRDKGGRFSKKGESLPDSYFIKPGLQQKFLECLRGRNIDRTPKFVGDRFTVAVGVEYEVVYTSGSIPASDVDTYRKSLADANEWCRSRDIAPFDRSGVAAIARGLSPSQDSHDLGSPSEVIVVKPVSDKAFLNWFSHRDSSGRWSGDGYPSWEDKEYSPIWPRGSQPSVGEGNYTKGKHECTICLAPTEVFSESSSSRRYTYRGTCVERAYRSYVGPDIDNEIPPKIGESFWFDGEMGMPFGIIHIGEPTDKRSLAALKSEGAWCDSNGFSSFVEDGVFIDEFKYMDPDHPENDKYVAVTFRADPTAWKAYKNEAVSIGLRIAEHSGATYSEKVPMNNRQRRSVLDGIKTVPKGYMQFVKVIYARGEWSDAPTEVAPGYEVIPAGTWNSRLGAITIYGIADAYAENWMATLLGHEAGHAVYDELEHESVTNPWTSFVLNYDTIRIGRGEKPLFGGTGGFSPQSDTRFRISPDLNMLYIEGHARGTPPEEGLYNKSVSIPLKDIPPKYLPSIILSTFQKAWEAGQDGVTSYSTESAKHGISEETFTEILGLYFDRRYRKRTPVAALHEIMDGPAKGAPDLVTATMLSLAMYSDDLDGIIDWEDKLGSPPRFSESDEPERDRNIVRSEFFQRGNTVIILYLNKDNVVVESVHGYPVLDVAEGDEFERKHPRDKGGRFAKKSDGGSDFQVHDEVTESVLVNPFASHGFGHRLVTHQDVVRTVPGQPMSVGKINWGSVPSIEAMDTPKISCAIPNYGWKSEIAAVLGNTKDKKVHAVPVGREFVVDGVPMQVLAVTPVLAADLEFYDPMRLPTSPPIDANEIWTRDKEDYARHYPETVRGKTISSAHRQYGLGGWADSGVAVIVTKVGEVVGHNNVGAPVYQGVITAPINPDDWKKYKQDAVTLVEKILDTGVKRYEETVMSSVTNRTRRSVLDALSVFPKQLIHSISKIVVAGHSREGDSRVAGSWKESDGELCLFNAGDYDTTTTVNIVGHELGHAFLSTWLAHRMANNDYTPQVDEWLAENVPEGMVVGDKATLRNLLLRLSDDGESLVMRDRNGSKSHTVPLSTVAGKYVPSMVAHLVTEYSVRDGEDGVTPYTTAWYARGNIEETLAEILGIYAEKQQAHGGVGNDRLLREEVISQCPTAKGLVSTMIWALHAFPWITDELGDWL